MPPSGFRLPQSADVDNAQAYCCPLMAWLGQPAEEAWSPLHVDTLGGMRQSCQLVLPWQGRLAFNTRLPRSDDSMRSSFSLLPSTPTSSASRRMAAGIVCC